MFVYAHLKVTVKSRAIASKMPPRFAKKQGGVSIEQPEDALSTNNLGTEIWETNSTGNTIHSTASCSVSTSKGFHTIFIIFFFIYEFFSSFPLKL